MNQLPKKYAQVFREYPVDEHDGRRVIKRSESNHLPIYEKYGLYTSWVKLEVEDAGVIRVSTRYFDPSMTNHERRIVENGELVKYEQGVDGGSFVEVWFKNNKPLALRHSTGGYLDNGIYPAICVWDGDSIVYVEHWRRGGFRCSATFESKRCSVRHGNNESYLAKASEHLPRFSLPFSQELLTADATPPLIVPASKARKTALKKHNSNLKEINDLISHQVENGLFSVEWKCSDERVRGDMKATLEKSGYVVAVTDHTLAISW